MPRGTLSTSRDATDLDRIAVEAVARAYLLRSFGPPADVHALRDADGLVVVLKHDPGHPVPRSWAAAAMAITEDATGGLLTAGGLVQSPGLIVLGFRGSLPPAPGGWPTRHPGRRRRASLRVVRA